MGGGGNFLEIKELNGESYIGASTYSANDFFQSVTVGETTTGNPGTQASVTNSGTGANAVLDFTIPKGADGHNPNLGTFLSTDSANFPTPTEDGDYIIVIDNTDPLNPISTIYLYDSDGSISGSVGWYNTNRDANDAYFHSGQLLGNVDIVNDLTTGGVNDVLSAEQGKKLKDDQDAMFEIGGVNLFDPSTAITNHKLISTGGIQPSESNFITSDFIEIGVGETFYCWFKYNNNNFINGQSTVCAYDENHQFISGSWTATVGEHGYTTPANTHYVRVSIQYSSTMTDQMMTKTSTRPTEYIPYKLIKSSLLPSVEVSVQFATNEYLNEVSILQTSGNSEHDLMSQKAITELIATNGVDSLLGPSTNLFNLSTAILNHKLTNSGGISSSTSNFATSDFIEIGAGVTLSEWSMLVTGTVYFTSPSVFCSYDENQDFIANSWNSNVTHDGYTTPVGTRYIRVSVPYDLSLYQTNYMVIVGLTVPTEYVPYKLIIKDEFLPFDENDIRNIAKDEVVNANSVEIVLPNRICAVVGDTIQLFQKGFIKAKNPYIYDIVTRVPAFGNSFPRYYEVTPTTQGDKTFTVQVKNTKGEILSSGSTTLHIVNAPTNPQSMKHIAIFGDSLVRGGQWPTELGRRLNGTGGTPAGNGLTNIKLIGSMGTQECGYYGMGGWTFENYISRPYLSLRFSVSGVSQWPYTNNMYAIDDVPLRARENNTTEGTILFRVTGKGWWKPNTAYAVGDIVYITQNGTDKIYKCTTAHTSSSTFDSSKWTDVTPSQTGNLVRTDATGGTTPIPYTSYVSESENPLWDNVNDKFSFVPYINQYGNGQVDAVYVCLVANGLNPSSYQSDIETAIEQLTTFADTLHSEYSSCKLYVMGMGMLDEKGSGEDPFLNLQGLNIAIMEKHKAFMEWCTQAGYSTWCEYVDVACQFDTDYAYPTYQKNVNVRSVETEILDSDSVHPSNVGYYQIADAIYRNIVANLCQ